MYCKEDEIGNRLKCILYYIEYERIFSFEVDGS